MSNFFRTVLGCGLFILAGCQIERFVRVPAPPVQSFVAQTPDFERGMLVNENENLFNQNRVLSSEEGLEINLIGECRQMEAKDLTLECAAVFDKYNVYPLPPEHEAVYQKLRAQLPQKKK